MREFQVRTVTVHGEVAPDLYAYARHKIGQLAKLAPGPVLLAKVKFDRAPDPAVARPALVQATLDVNGLLVHAEVAARHFDEAIDLLEARLRHRLGHLAGRRRQRHPRRETVARGSRSGPRRRGRLAAREDRLPEVDRAERAPGGM